MVKLNVNLKAELDNLTDLQVEDPMNYQYFFKVKCSNCHEIHNNWVGISRSEEYPLSGSKGSANFVWKCQLCQREASASFIDLKAKAFPMYTKTQSQEHKAQAICTVECRGCEFVEYDIRGSWTCKGAESGTEFQGIEFDDGEWHDYDEKSGLPVSVTNVKTEIVRA
ncbi:hypothetical protein PGT21_033550 [Puccinia graminis f. sp. tritici]|uniref:DUF866-domain-containing protein n=1 Tax=Puccinia graminis f. sp. tritici TaxID=56615 RepID=A0A5B0Q811_PUCGR|nr:hypothetical protein PGT21_033550 [Puccinia graminis f. sp. tritici]KAA1109396.1 hypothetical protein PGTUg99_032014 [Puccinia graminis f. sp. tritici]